MAPPLTQYLYKISLECLLWIFPGSTTWYLHLLTDGKVNLISQFCVYITFELSFFCSSFTVLKQGLNPTHKLFTVVLWYWVKLLQKHYLENRNFIAEVRSVATKDDIFFKKPRRSNDVSLLQVEKLNLTKQGSEMYNWYVQDCIQRKNNCCLTTVNKTFTTVSKNYKLIFDGYTYGIVVFVLRRVIGVCLFVCQCRDGMLLFKGKEEGRFCRYR